MPEDDGQPRIRLSKGEKLRLRKPRRNSLIVNPYGRNLDFMYFTQRLNGMWKPQERMPTVDLGHGFIRVSFALTNDFVKVLRDGPWFIGKLFVTIQIFSDCIRDWNKSVFGNVFHRKKHTLAGIAGVQRVLASNPNNFLVNLDRSLNREYEEILKQEEEIWIMKSPANRLTEGDRNTTFFHVSTLIRRKSNRISALKGHSGDWSYDAIEIQQIVQIPCSSEVVPFTRIFLVSRLNVQLSSPRANLSIVGQFKLNLLLLGHLRDRDGLNLTLMVQLLVIQIRFLSCRFASCKQGIFMGKPTCVKMH
ncbi:hypothetical protein CRG98_008464 [Punica granatum]|uniref:DUF4283 domain-containing protein n=1 Tax=Punica granatum TaxID=22663 RepID=A0A2I0KTI3_PUNGR|nr:hypothetical protein CRG98_008464 [Punica granatum]